MTRAGMEPNLPALVACAQQTVPFNQFSFDNG